jgi:hypothetical protein
MGLSSLGFPAVIRVTWGAAALVGPHGRMRGCDLAVSPTSGHKGASSAPRRSVTVRPTFSGAFPFPRGHGFSRWGQCLLPGLRPQDTALQLGLESSQMVHAPTRHSPTHRCSASVRIMRKHQRWARVSDDLLSLGRGTTAAG